MKLARHYSYVRTRAALAAALALAFAASLAGREHPDTDDNSSVLIQLFIPGPVSSLGTAREVASEILEDTGIDVRWAECAPWTPPHKRSGDCAPDTEDLVIEVRFEYATPEQYKPGVLGETLPFTASPVPSRIFVDRVLALRGSPAGGRVLGHVLAHEIGHVLLESDWHSLDGLMSPRWKARDLMDIGSGVLNFSDAEIRMMHRAMSTRSKRHPPKLSSEGVN